MSEDDLRRFGLLPFERSGVRSSCLVIGGIGYRRQQQPDLIAALDAWSRRRSMIQRLDEWREQRQPLGRDGRGTDLLRAVEARVRVLESEVAWLRNPLRLAPPLPELWGIGTTGPGASADPLLTLRNDPVAEDRTDWDERPRW